MGPNQVLPLQDRVDLGAKSVKEYFTFPNLQGWSLNIRRICYIQETQWVASYPSAEMLSVYSTAPTDWASNLSWLFFFSIDATLMSSSRFNYLILAVDRLDSFTQYQVRHAVDPLLSSALLYIQTASHGFII